MPKKKQAKQYILKIHAAPVWSRFVVDLKQKQAKPEEVLAAPKSKLDKLEQAAEKIAAYDFLGAWQKTAAEPVEKLLRAGKSLRPSRILSLFHRCSSPKIQRPSQVEQRSGGQVSRYSPNIFNQLLFIVFAKFIITAAKKISLTVYKIFFKISFSVGWLVLFIVRLIYFSSRKLCKAAIIPLNLMADKTAGLKSHILQTTSQVVQSTANRLNEQAEDIKESANQLFARERKKITGLHLKEKIKRGLANLIPLPKLSYLRRVAFFSVVLFMLILPFKALTYYKVMANVKARVLGASEQAVNDIKAGGASASRLDFNQAGADFSQAAANFLNAQAELNDINGLIFTLAAIAPDKDLRLAAASKNILRVGQLSAEFGNNLSLAMASLLPSSNTASSSSNYLTAAAQNQLGMKEKINSLANHSRQALTNLTEIARLLKQIDSSVLPEQYQSQFILLKQKIASLNQTLAVFSGIVDELGDFLGLVENKRYLLVFQNNGELRASGGFIGSFALVDFQHGQIKNIEAPGGGSYDTDAGLFLKIASPEPLQLINPLWHFWDANWWPDWPASAKKLMWFYEKSDGPTVNGVISLTPTVVEKLLAITGPIDLTEKYNLTISSGNFLAVVQELSEQKPQKTKQPKRIIGDLMDKIINDLSSKLNNDNLVALLQIINQSLNQKDILFYFTDDNLQKKMEDLNWGGQIKDTGLDYLSVINTNIGGGKSDKKIKQVIEHRAEIMPDGSVIDSLKISRSHSGVKGEPWYGQRNLNWLRIYVPPGSELLEASGFEPVNQIFFEATDPAWQKDHSLEQTEGQAKTEEKSGTKIYDEFNKTVFANWSQTDPGQTTEIYIKYRLPFKLNFSAGGQEQTRGQNLLDRAMALLNPAQKNLHPYSILAQKQPGMDNCDIKSQLIINNKKVVWKYPKDTAVNDTGWDIKESFDQDKFWAVLIE